MIGWHDMRGALIRTIMLILIGLAIVVVGLAIDTNGFTRGIWSPGWMQTVITNGASSP